VVTVFELVEGEVRVGNIVYSLVEGGSRSCLEVDVGMMMAMLDDIASDHDRRKEDVRVDRVYSWEPC